jgi:hypothetical protein
MAAFSDYAEKLIFDWLFTTGAATRPTAWFVGLFTTATDDATGGTEVSGGAYARTAVTFAAGTTPGGTTSNSAAVTFPAATANWGTVTHVAIFDAASGGNRLMHGALTTARTVSAGDTFSFAAGQIALTVA